MTNEQGPNQSKRPNLRLSTGGAGTRTGILVGIAAFALIALLAFVINAGQGQAEHADNAPQGPQAKSMQIRAGVTGYDCSGGRWVFQITGIKDRDSAPESIDVAWEGAAASLRLSRFGGDTATYVSSANQGSQVTGASTDIYKDWDGDFSLVSGPCAQDAPTETPADAAPTQTAPPDTNGGAATETPVPAADCDASRDLTTSGLRDGGRGIQASFTNNSTSCTYQVGVATYKRFNRQIDSQELFDSDTSDVAPGETVTLSAGLPACSYQADAFWGDVIDSLNGARYGNRLLDDTNGNGNNYCDNVPTETPAPPTETETPAPPTETETPVPPTATETPSTNCSYEVGGFRGCIDNDGNLAFTTSLRNEGSSAVQLQGKVELFDVYGHRVGSYDIPVTEVGPDSAKAVSGTVGGAADRSAGPYKVRVSVWSSDGQCGAQTEEFPVEYCQVPPTETETPKPTETPTETPVPPTETETPVPPTATETPVAPTETPATNCDYDVDQFTVGCVVPGQPVRVSVPLHNGGATPVKLWVNVQLLKSNGDSIDNKTIEALVVPANSTRNANFSLSFRTEDLGEGPYSLAVSVANVDDSECRKIHVTVPIELCQVPTETPTTPPTETETPVPPTDTPTETPVPDTNTPTRTPVPPTATPTNTPAPNCAYEIDDFSISCYRADSPFRVSIPVRNTGDTAVTVSVRAEVLNASGDAVDSQTIDALVVQPNSTRFATMDLVISSGSIGSGPFTLAVTVANADGDSTCPKLHETFPLTPCQVPTNTPTETPFVPTETPTNTPTVTETPFVPTNTPTETPFVPTNTPTETPFRPTDTPTETPFVPTNTPTPTETRGPRDTPTPTNTPAPNCQYVPELTAGCILDDGSVPYVVRLNNTSPDQATLSGVIQLLNKDGTVVATNSIPATVIGGNSQGTVSGTIYGAGDRSQAPYRLVVTINNAAGQCNQQETFDLTYCSVPTVTPTPEVPVTNTPTQVVPTPTPSCQYLAELTAGCILDDGSVPYQVRLTNNSAAPATLSGRVQLINNAGQVVASNDIPATIVNGNSQSTVSGTIYGAADRNQGPYRLVVVINNSDGQCSLTQTFNLTYCNAPPTATNTPQVPATPTNTPQVPATPTPSCQYLVELTARCIENDGSVPYQVRLVNNGSQQATLSGRVQLVNGSGQVVSTADIPATIVNANSQSTVAGTIYGAADRNQGPYRLVVTITSSDGLCNLSQTVSLDYCQAPPAPTATPTPYTCQHQPTLTIRRVTNGTVEYTVRIVGPSSERVTGRVELVNSSGQVVATNEISGSGGSTINGTIGTNVRDNYRLVVIIDASYGCVDQQQSADLGEIGPATGPKPTPTPGEISEVFPLNPPDTGHRVSPLGYVVAVLLAGSLIGIGLWFRRRKKASDVKVIF